ncbi:lytic transglycosylase domain-containing protein [Asticcacaulis sp.]|uniref:lytic transglycosylase domain-containing protein n=1 Tax=Asticcacaulis sp. TaxID=1872648 RepID=UPI002BA3DAAD|nr:lytic transglycosylase domain-containing protein [Asticcacaulis sp.]HTM81918.1 lytic transglycosylase domain-containing protein [Asticcacaulis sp.]
MKATALIIACLWLVSTGAWAETLQSSVRPVWQRARLAPWSAYIDEAAARFAVPRDWIEGVILAESGGKNSVNGQPTRSRAGAMGLMQLMPATYEEMRLAFSLGANPDDPRDNILAGTAYLRRMYDLYQYPGLFAAYNAGPARYETSLRGEKLPKETRLYLAELTRKGPGLASRAALFVGVAAKPSTDNSTEKPALFVVLNTARPAEN